MLTDFLSRSALSALCRSRYTRGCDVIVFVIDTTAPNDIPTARKELHQLLEDRDLAKLPLLILANKIDLGPKISEPELIKGLNLDYITENPWLIVPVSAKDGTNVDQALEFLLKQSRG
jgi:ADP-ribosylation factor-like protein 8